VLVHLIFQGRLGSFSFCWFSDELLTSYDPTVTSFEILLRNLQGYSSFWVIHLNCLSSSRRAILYSRIFKSLILKFLCLCPWIGFQDKFADCKKSSSVLQQHAFCFMTWNFHASLKALLPSVCLSVIQRNWNTVILVL
jgi:hypothetical protein